MPTLKNKLSRVALPALAIAFIATLFVMQNPLLNILLSVPLIAFLGLSAKQISGSAISSALVMAVTLIATMLNTDRMAHQSAELYKICETQMINDTATTPDVAVGSNCAERYLAPNLWRLKA